MDLNILVTRIKSAERTTLTGTCNSVCLTCFSANVE